MGRLWAAGYAAIGWRNRIQTPPLFHPLVKRLEHGFVNLDLAGVREYVDVFRKARDELADAFQELHLEKTMARRIGWGNLWLWDSFDSTFDDRCRQHPNSPLCRHFLPILPRDKPAFDFEEYLFAVYSMEPNTNLSMHNDGSNARVSRSLVKKGQLLVEQVPSSKQTITKATTSVVAIWHTIQRLHDSLLFRV